MKRALGRQNYEDALRMKRALGRHNKKTLGAHPFRDFCGMGGKPQMLIWVENS
jgi:hypothetical protein